MLKWINKKRNKKGFTLIELVVVIAILGILAAIAVPRLGGFRDSAQDAADEASAATIEKAANLYVAANDITAGGQLYGLVKADSTSEFVEKLKSLDLIDEDTDSTKNYVVNFNQTNGEFTVTVTP